mmetsp:Transcript_21271/g.55522  ORF Transcript_21271/g.55522 Transcript_21271/m.55522 type:complete len:214 (-) Transcript_21271:810-1451(-)
MFPEGHLCNAGTTIYPAVLPRHNITSSYSWRHPLGTPGCDCCPARRQSQTTPAAAPKGANLCFEASSCHGAAAACCRCPLAPLPAALLGAAPLATPPSPLWHRLGCRRHAPLALPPAERDPARAAPRRARGWPASSRGCPGEGEDQGGGMPPYSLRLAACGATGAPSASTGGSSALAMWGAAWGRLPSSRPAVPASPWGSHPEFPAASLPREW